MVRFTFIMQSLSLLFKFGCTGSSLLLGLPVVGVQWAAHWGGSSCCRARASLVAACRLTTASLGAVIVVHGLRYSSACGITLIQGSNLCPLHWQADSYPLYHQGSPTIIF